MPNKLEEHIRIHKMIGAGGGGGTGGGDSWNRITCDTGFVLASDSEETLTISGTNGISTIGINAGKNLDEIQIDGSALLPVDGSRGMSGDLDLQTNDILNVNAINGVLWADIYWTETELNSLYVRRDGTTPLTGNWDVGNFDIVNINQLAVGTATPGAWQTNIVGNGLYSGFLSVAGGIHVGATSDPGDDNLIVDGLTGLGIVPINKLDVNGGTAMGSAYAGTETAPTNGLIVEGSVGIGTKTPQVALEVNGDIRISDRLDTRGDEDLIFVRNHTDIAKLTISGFEPAVSETFDLGAPSNRWRDLYLAGDSIYLGTTKINSTVSGLDIDTDLNVGLVNSIDVPVLSSQVEALEIQADTLEGDIEDLASGFDAHIVSGVDAHREYLLADGSRELGMSWNVGAQEILNVSKLAIGRADVPSGIMAIEFATSGVELIDAGTDGATEGGWIEIRIGGATKYIRLYDTK